MRLNAPMQNPTVLLSLFMLLGWSAASSAAVDGFPGSALNRPEFQTGSAGPILLVENENGDRESTPPASGTLVLPENQLAPEDKSGDKKCMTVCARWGKECQYINRGNGGLSEKCRRTCKQFSEECF